MAESERPRENVSLHVPRGVYWASLLALVGWLAREAFVLEGELIRSQIQIGSYEARFKSLEDRAAHCESENDVLRHRIDELHSQIR